MSALLQDTPTLRPMREEDLEAIMEIERDVYNFPWTKGNFHDSLKAGYSCWIYQFGPLVVGYGVMMLSVGEAHLLNVVIARDWQKKGLGWRFVQHLILVAREYKAEMMFLEVRPSNEGARKLYRNIGFNEIAVRKNYYPAAKGREDAILMGLSL